MSGLACVPYDQGHVPCIGGDWLLFSSLTSPVEPPSLSAGTLDGDPIYYQELKLIQPRIAKGVSRLIINLCSSGFPVEILFFWSWSEASRVEEGLGVLPCWSIWFACQFPLLNISEHLSRYSIYCCQEIEFDTNLWIVILRLLLNLGNWVPLLFFAQQIICLVIWEAAWAVRLN